MAINMTRKYSKTEVWAVVTQTPPGTPVLDPVNSTPGVTITGSGDYTKSSTIGPYTISGQPVGGVGLLPLQATVAIDGAFRFPVIGASATTPVNTLVYRVTATGLLSLSSASAVAFGKIDRFIGKNSATECSVWTGKAF